MANKKGKNGNGKNGKGKKDEKGDTGDSCSSNSSTPPMAQNKVLKSPVTSSVDRNEYKTILLPNGIRALLISTDSSVSLPLWHHRSSNPYGIKSHEGILRKGTSQNVIHACPKENGQELWRDSTFSHMPVPSTLPVMDRDFEIPTFDREVAECIRRCTTETEDSLAPESHKKNSVGGSSPPPLETSCVSVNINVGSASDPDDHCGLAHFLEHMVHYGSKEYPDEDAYFRFMHESAVELNAFTQSDTTTYFFECFTECLETSLDMLTSMLANPLLLEDVVSREIHSVDNEYLLKEKYKVWKFHEILCSAAKKEHPINSFMCGNLASLLNGRKNVKTLTQTLKKFHEKHYVGSKTTVAIKSHLPIPELEKLVSSKFNKLQRGTGSIRRETVPDEGQLDPFDTDEFRTINFIVSRGISSNLMQISWGLRPEVWKDYLNRPLDFISHLLRQEWEGGVMEKLKKGGYIIDVVAAECLRHEDARNKYCSLFQMLIRLSEGGKEVESLKKILITVYEGLRSLDKMSLDDKKQLWDEFYTVRKREFDFSGPGVGINFVSSCSRLLQNLPEDEIFRGEVVPSPDFNNEVFTKTLACLTPKNMNVSLACPSYPKSVLGLKTTTKKEKFTGVSYQRCSLEQFGGPSFMKKLKDVKLTQLSPGKSMFLGNEDPPKPFVIEPFKYPDSIQKLKGKHYGNTHKKVFKCILGVRFICSSALVNVRSQKLMHLLYCCIFSNQRVRIQESELVRGGVQIRAVPMSQLGFIMMGFPQPLVKGAQAMLRSFFMALQEIDQRSFDMWREFLVIKLKESLGDPSSISSNLFMQVLIKEFGPIEKEIKALEKLEFRDLANFVEAFKVGTVATVEASGNISKNNLDIIIHTVSQLGFSSVLWSQSKLIIPLTYLGLPSGHRCIRVKSNVRACGNTSVTNIYSFPTCGPLEADAIMFVEKLMRGAVFWYLRTFKQLGYAVSSGFDYVLHPMIFITVVGPASKHSACSFDESIDSFLNLFWDMCLTQLTEQDVEELKQRWRFPAGGFTLEHILLWYATEVLPNIERNTDLVCKWNANKTFTTKMSIQVLGNDEEICKGHNKNKKCDHPVGFRKPKTGKSSCKDRNNNDTDDEKILVFAENAGDSKRFISDLKAYKKDS